MKMLNLSDKPVFDYGFAIISRSRRRIVKLAREGWKQNPMFKWPENNKFSCHIRYSLLNYHDGTQLYLSPEQQVEHQPQLEFNDVVYDYYAYFRDTSGKYWAVNARTQRLASLWRRWRLGLARRTRRHVAVGRLRTRRGSAQPQVSVLVVPMQ